MNKLPTNCYVLKSYKWNIVTGCVNTSQSTETQRRLTTFHLQYHHKNCCLHAVLSSMHQVNIWDFNILPRTRLQVNCSRAMNGLNWNSSNWSRQLLNRLVYRILFIICSRFWFDLCLRTSIYKTASNHLQDMHNSEVLDRSWMQVINWKKCGVFATGKTTKSRLKTLTNKSQKSELFNFYELGFWGIKVAMLAWKSQAAFKKLTKDHQETCIF